MIGVDELLCNYRTWLGVKFLHQGRTRLGCDCLGFIAAGANEVGSSIFLEQLPGNYARNPQSLLLEKLGELTRKIDEQPGALITVQWPLHEFASHGAVLTREGTIIHCNQPNGKVVEHTYGGQWRQRTHSIWAIPLVIYQ